MIRAFAFLLTFIPGVVFAHENGFRVLGNSMPPFGIIEDNKITGFSLDLLKQVYTYAGLDFEENRVVNAPFARMYNELKHKDQRIGMHVARSPDRENLFKWVGPYYEISMGLIAKKSRWLRLNSASDINRYRVGVVRDTLPEQLLAKLEVREEQIIATSGPENALQMLAADRIDVFAHLLDVSRYLMGGIGMEPSLYEEKYSLRTSQLYFALSKGTNEQTVLQLQDGLSRFFASRQCITLHARYQLMNNFCTGPAQ